MKSFNLLCAIAIAVVLLVFTSVAPTRGADPKPKPDTHDISHAVKVETGGTWFRDGDKITIDEIRGTSDKIEVGHLYEIKGTYTLKSHEQARLTVDITSNDPRHFPSMNTQTQFVNKGDGHFTVYLYTWCDGNPHLSFYPMDRNPSFTSIYFGSGDNVLKHVSWLDDPKE